MLNVNDDTKFQTLHEHYKDSYAIIQNSLNLRDKLLLLILLTIAFMLFQVFSPSIAGEVLSQLLLKKIELTNCVLDITFLGSIIWFGLLCLTLRYFQTLVYIERQYNYLHGLEESISSLYDKKAFTREGASYLKNYPIFSDWAHIVYTIGFPLSLLLIVFIKIFAEYSSLGLKSFFFWIDGIFFLAILISTLLYLLLIHFKK